MTIDLLHMNHINAVVEDFDASVRHFEDTFGMQFVLDVPSAEWHACLMVLGGVIIEWFVPPEYLLNARHGAHYVGIEYQVDDVDAARDEIVARGIRVIRDLGHTIHTHPTDGGFGVAMELFGRNFHTDTKIRWGEVPKPATYWRDEHPLGCAGLKRNSLAVHDLDAATAFFGDLYGTTVLYDEDRPAVTAVARGLKFADTVVELLSPVGEGTIQQYLDRNGEGLRSTVFQVRDLDQAERHLNSRGIELQPGDAPGALAVDPAANRGILFEFSE